jgi:CHAT domain-containing protein
MRPFRRSVALAGLSALLVTFAPQPFGWHDIAYAQANRNSGNLAELQAEYEQLVQLFNSRHFEPMAERGPLLWEQFVALGSEASELSVEILQLIIDSDHKLGRYAEAIKYEQRLVAIGERHAAPGWAAVYKAAVATDYSALGRFVEAERLYKEVLTYEEEKRRPSPRDIADFATTLYDLAELYRDQGRYEEAEPLFKRALAIREKAPRDCQEGMRGHCQRADVVRHSEALAGLASLYRIEGRYGDAEQLLKAALAITEKLNGNDYILHPMQPNVYWLGVLYKDTGRLAEADQYLRYALSLLDRPGLDVPYASPQYALNALDALGEVNTKLGRYAEAKGYDERALALARNLFGERHLAVARSLGHFAELDRATGDLNSALRLSRTAVGIATAAMDSASTAVDVAAIRPHFETHLGILAQARVANVESAGLVEEAFDVAQSADQSSAGAALNQMAARFGAGNDLLAQLVRERQDTARELEAANKAVVNGLSAAGGSTDVTRSLRGRVAELQQKLDGLDKRLATEFPDYAALASPQPLKSEEIRRLLTSDEGLLFFLTAEKESYVFVLTRESFEWQTIPVGAKELSDKVSAFRRGLDPDSLTPSANGGPPVLFDLAGAHALYRALIGPVEAEIKAKKQLLIVPSGVLTALPFHLLVTGQPSGAVPSPDNLTPYRDASWLIKSHALTVLPSVASLKALRVLAHRDEAAKPMVGFGAPQFDPNAPIASTDADVRTASRRLTTRSFADFFQGVGVDRARLAQALPPLPDTADELTAVAKDLGAPSGDIHLGKDASETTLKRLPLADYRIVYFATHGLVAGDIKGLAEPSLALSIPAQPSDLDDGLLTASEVAQLKLNADWVVLSACNTVAGDKPGAEALSGLARAFFYAGARALLVSHWAVDSNAATRLTTSTFDLLKSNPNVGRAEALQHAMLAYLGDASDARNAYPAFWAPFEIVGEGVAR